MRHCQCLGQFPRCKTHHYKSNHSESTKVQDSITYLENRRLPFKALKDGDVIVRDGERVDVFERTPK